MSTDGTTLRGKIAEAMRTMADALENAVPGDSDFAVERTADVVSITFPDHAEAGWPRFEARLPARFEIAGDFPALFGRGAVFQASGQPADILERFSELGLEWATDSDGDATPHHLRKAAEAGARILELGSNAYCFVSAGEFKTTALIVQLRSRVGDDSPAS